MLFIYRLAGIVAIIGLIINICILFGSLALFGFTLTMPGIAGLVLTIGMAVDANVLIYERLREEMEAGKTLTGALEAAYEKAFSAIADSNITTLISAVILFVISGGLVKGFAVTLMIGLLSSMIGALIVTRVIFMWVVDKNLLKKFTPPASSRTRSSTSSPKRPLSSSPRSSSRPSPSPPSRYKGKDGSLGIDFRGGGRVDVVLARRERHSGQRTSTPSSRRSSSPEAKGSEIGTYYIQRKSDPATGSTNVSIRCEEDSGSGHRRSHQRASGKEGTVRHQRRHRRQCP
jgi:SecD/SecF fusion protein